MAATIKDIARKLNISISTVSYALNGGPRGVPPDVREKVLAVARELNYRPNSLARSMAIGRTDTISIVPPRGTHPLILSPYIQAVINAIVQAAETLRQDILLHTAQGDGDSRALARSVLGGRADGIFLIAPALNSSLPREIASRRVPCVIFSAEGPEGTLTVTIDNAAATQQAMDHLTALGHTRIGHIVGRLEMRDAVQRRDAFVQYVRERGLALREEWVLPGDFYYQKAREAARTMLTRPERPTAILAANDESGLAAIDMARDLGIAVPEDLSVVAFDALAEEFLPTRSLTAVHQPIAAMISQGMELLVQWARDRARPETARHVFATELVARESTGPAPGTS